MGRLHGFGALLVSTALVSLAGVAPPAAAAPDPPAGAQGRAGTNAFPDFNGDGNEDDVWYTVGAYFSTILLDAQGRHLPGGANYCQELNPPHAEFPDLDGDGSHDVLTAYRCSGEWGVMVGSGANWNGPKLKLATGPGPITASLVAGSGHLRPVIRVYDGQYADYFFNVGNWNFGRYDPPDPTVGITSPGHGELMPAHTPITVRGTVSNIFGGGPVRSVRVSTDGGVTWQPATGLANWSHEWTPVSDGPATLRVRVEDSNRNVVETSRTVVVDGQQCPCTILGSGRPARADSGDPAAVELGVRFRSSTNALVTGVRFYKSDANTGTHTGSLWTATGTRLATGTFTDETASGWQTLTFATPVPIRAGTTYVASYWAPNGHYSADLGFFHNRRAGFEPLTAPSYQVAGGNGVHQLGAGFPDRVQNGALNYWVDVMTSTDGVDQTSPTVDTSAPADQAVAVPTGTEISATFTEDVDPASVRFDVRAGGGAAVAGEVVTDGDTSTFLTSEPLAAGTTYRVRLDAADPMGNALTPTREWSFTTGSTVTDCPCTILHDRRPTVADAGDGSDVELGVRFATSVRTVATGVRFYRSAANTGTHTGSLWTSAGTRLATGTFTGETTSGWQTLTFEHPVELAAGTTYVASYHAPNGHYASDRDYFATAGAGRVPVTAAPGDNGVYRYGGGFPGNSYRSSNYWVDVVVDTDELDLTAPAVATATPAAGATGVGMLAGVTASFDEEIDPATVSVALTGPGGSVAGTMRIADDNRGVAFAPTAALAAGTVYTVAVAAEDVHGNAMATPATWSFTTGADACPCTLFTVAEAPSAAIVDSPVELGMRWRADRDGLVTGVRVYRTAGDTGTHTGTLWSTAGVALATGTFGGTGVGWQTLTFDTPVAVTAGTDHVVSYHSSSGRYGSTGGDLATARTRGPLTAPAHTPGVPNGVYRYGDGGVLPTGEADGRNYWVDVVFTSG